MSARSSSFYLQEQERLYGRTPLGGSFGWIDGWLEVGMRDRWCLDSDNRVLVRFHAAYRLQLFHSPSEIKQKFPQVEITGRRKTWYKFSECDPGYMCGDVTNGAKKLAAPWIGRTELEIMLR